MFRQSQELLLQCATPDAVARLPYTQLAQQADRLWSTYFTTQKHSSLTAFLKNVLAIEEREEDIGSLIQVIDVVLTFTRWNNKDFVVDSLTTNKPRANTTTV